MRQFVPPIISDRQHWFNRLTWKLLLGIALIDIVWIAFLGWDIDWHNIGILAGFVIPTAFTVLLFTRFYREPPFALMVQLVLQFILIPYTTAALNYVTSTMDLPLQDGALVAVDRFFDFDWIRYVIWVREHQWLARAYSFSYNSAWGQFLLLIVLLFTTGRLDRMQHLTFAVLLGAALTSLIFAIIPAMGGYWYFHVDPATLPGTAYPAAGLVHIPHLTALRSGQFHRMDLHFEGIVTFPSFHTTFGLLMLYAAWPFRWLRTLYIILDALLILSTPVDGGHYVIDVIGGVFIFIGVVLIARKLLPLSPPMRMQTVAPKGEGDYISASLVQ